jgi:hypothetical protein
VSEIKVVHKKDVFVLLHHPGQLSRSDGKKKRIDSRKGKETTVDLRFEVRKY